jgi:FkbM family methyltransferase
MLKVIYDLGAHTGADIPYYLHKADKVVAVEANPELAGQLSAKFHVAVQKGHLFVENLAVTEIEGEGPMSFFLNNKADVLGTLLKPQVNSSHYSEIVVETASIDSLIRKHGLPYFVKIDLEGADMSILRAMAKEDLFPPFISVEGHDPGVFGVLAALGNYKSFKLQYGALVERQFKRFQFRDRFGAVQTYSFPAHAAGPFGDDLPSRWTTPLALNDVISLHGTGW